jgi:hypothetical protein
VLPAARSLLQLVQLVLLVLLWPAAVVCPAFYCLH